MSKILGFLKRKKKEIKVFNTSDKDNIYFRLYCTECGADFIIKFSDMKFEGNSDLSGSISIYKYDCPNCESTYSFIMNPEFIFQNWCDDKGDYMLDDYETFYIDNVLMRGSAHLNKPCNDSNYVSVERTEDNIITDENALCKTSDYNSIKEDDVPKTDEFNEDYETNAAFYMTHIEYIQLQNFHKVHNDCMINPETGMHRFGAIGGGISVSYIISVDGTRSVVAHCDYCNTTKNLSEDTDTCLTAEEIIKIEDRYKYYHSYPDKMSKVEYLRYKKFCEDRIGETISVRFMGTGLGSLIIVKSETIGEYADITDIDSW